MGKKKRLNRLISRWIKSDLPQEDGSPTVLLLGVTRIPTSPPPRPRRPRSLALVPNHNQSKPTGINVNPSNNSQPTRARPVSVVHPYTFSRPPAATPIPERELAQIKCGLQPLLLKTPSLVADASESSDDTPTNASGVGGDAESPVEWSSSAAEEKSRGDSSSCVTNMERSVDSIGACSLDVDASAELLSDWCENPSVDTLRSASIKSLTPQQEHRLPSYLSLACTVNGYSQITNYDPVRLAKSRDSSPHRPLIDNDHLTYAIQNNLLSPPNLVPLPFTDRFRLASAASANAEKMTERTRTITHHHHHEEFYSKKKMFISTETTSRKYNYIDRVDACMEKSNGRAYNGHLNGHSNSNGHVNGSSEPKSFIQQRVERLYGPGALAQGFFVMKRQKSRNSESDAHVQCDHLNVDYNDKHSKSMSDKILLDADGESDSIMKQSASSPSLPVLRHLTPEFRAQLPTFSPRRGVDTLQKSNTLPQLKDIEAEMLKAEVLTVSQNGVHLHDENMTKLDKQLEHQHLHENNNCLNGAVGKIATVATVDDDVKDGHYFLRILENEAVRLLKLADKAEEELDAGEGKLNENGKGFLRSAAGKARLLVSQKMQQFRGLCTNNLNQAEGEAFPTTNQDLQGFWDMVMLQVDQIDSIFKELDVLRANNWQEVISKPVDTVDKGKSRTKVNLPAATRVRSAGAEEARAKREAQRKQMIEQRRKAMRDAMSKAVPNESIEIYVPESS